MRKESAALRKRKHRLQGGCGRPGDPRLLAYPRRSRGAGRCQHIDETDRTERRRSDTLAALHSARGQLPRDCVCAGQRTHQPSRFRLCGVRCSLIRRVRTSAPRRSCHGGAAQQSTRSIRAASRIPTATASAISPELRRSSITSRGLGVDCIWLSPFFTSPMRDFGYDVADYCGVDPVFGTAADFDALVARAHSLGLKVIIDQVYSHSSDQHPWFQESRSDRDNPRADWYVWADAKPDGSPPNNWQSVFGGPAWTWDARRGQYYLHNFLKEQPDLNLHNRDVQDALLDVARFWLDRGVDGFRIDAINFAMHDPELRDNPPAPNGGKRTRPFDFQQHLYNQSHPDIVKFLERLREVTDSYGERFTLAEVGGEHALKEMKEFTRRRQAAQQRVRLRLPIRRAADAQASCERRRGMARRCRMADLGIRESRCAARDLALGGRGTSRQVRPNEDAAAVQPSRLDHPLAGRGAGAAAGRRALRPPAGSGGDCELAADSEPRWSAYADAVASRMPRSLASRQRSPGFRSAKATSISQSIGRMRAPIRSCSSRAIACACDARIRLCATGRSR